ncbi:ATP-binding cassette domain-containing protein [Streptomyces odontomachi]|uniref:ATP-binding cassette domain-containing protein n=1 Tax=Streptomyces odontomachi TaxID=2944940 RepID=UPI0021090866|nr:ATP-binding cassette domain-containing protein [Streptomyces sp. ODS25]
MIQAIGLTSNPRKELLIGTRREECLHRSARGQEPPRQQNRHDPQEDRPEEPKRRRASWPAYLRGVSAHPRRPRKPLLDDVSLEARPGEVTVLLAPHAVGGTALRLMLELEPGRGLTLFRGRPLHRIAHPAREVGVLLGDVPGHPGRTVRGHLRMLCAAAGLPSVRADEVLEDMGLVSLRGEVLGSLSRGLDRRFGMACALLTDPHTLVLDAPTGELAPHEARWLHGLLGEHARNGGAVLFTTADPKEAAHAADHVITLEGGKVVADQRAAEFARTRLRPRVAVRSPHAARLGVLLTKEARAAHRPIEVVQEDGNRLSVYGSNCACIGETAFRHGILIHRLADEIGDMGTATRRPTATLRAPGDSPNSKDAAAPGPIRGARHHAPTVSPVPASTHTSVTTQLTAPKEFAPAAEFAAPTDRAPSAEHATVAASLAAPLRDLPPRTSALAGRGPEPAAAVPPPVGGRDDAPSRACAASLPPPIVVWPARGPLRPLRYEVRRVAGVTSGYVIATGVVVTSAVLCVLLARVGRTPQPYVLAAWPRELPLPPAALGAGLLGALAFGEEYRYPALAADRGTVPRRLGLLGAKLLVAGGTALLLAGATIGGDVGVLHLVHGARSAVASVDWVGAATSWFCLVVGCAWAGVLAAGLFRSTSAGLAAVLSVPLVVMPVVRWALAEPTVRASAGIPGQLGGIAVGREPVGTGPWASAVARMVGQPVGSALVLSLIILFCAFLLTRFRGRAR